MGLRKYPDANAFVTIDLDDAPAIVGVARLAAKVLQSSSWDLTRSMTYQLASFEHQVSGASAGISATPDQRDTALAAFTDEMVTLGGDLPAMFDASTGLAPDDLAPLVATDTRATASLGPSGAAARNIHLTAVGAVAAAGGLDGRTFAIEGLRDELGLAIARLATEQGASLRGVSTSAGSIVGDIDVETLAGGWAAAGPAVVEQLGDVTAAGAVLGADVDVLFAGSRTSAVSHDEAPAITAATLVPTAPLVVTARALAMLGRSGTVVLPDFVTTAGPVFGWWPSDPDADDAAVDAAAAAGLAGSLAEVLGHDEGPVLGACYRAEGFLSSWCEKLPFGRPLAS